MTDRVDSAPTFPTKSTMHEQTQGEILGKYSRQFRKNYRPNEIQIAEAISMVFQTERLPGNILEVYMNLGGENMGKIQLKRINRIIKNTNKLICLHFEKNFAQYTDVVFHIKCSNKCNGEKCKVLSACQENKCILFLRRLTSVTGNAV